MDPTHSPIKAIRPMTSMITARFLLGGGSVISVGFTPGSANIILVLLNSGIFTPRLGIA